MRYKSQISAVQMNDANAAMQSTPYFDNGDIIITCPSRDKAKRDRHFRVDKIVLCRHSPVFRTMLSLPGKPGSEDSMDGVSTVYIPDGAEDMEGFLKAMYDPS